MMYKNKLDKVKNIPQLFNLVKNIVQDYLRKDQAGLMVAISDLGTYGEGFIGAFYSLGSNIIIINKRPLKRIKQTNPSIYNFYLFHILLHEYIHSIGLYNEEQTRQLVYQISNHYFGAEHPVTQLAINIENFIPNLTYQNNGFQPREEMSIEFVDGIDRENTNYIN